MIATTRVMPETDKLVTEVCAALEEVASTDEMVQGCWTTATCKVLEKRLIDPSRYPEGIECGYQGRGRDKVYGESELLFDFSAVLCEPNDRNVERYTIQLLIAGEIERHNDLGRDFDKLMYADSVVLFFVSRHGHREGASIVGRRSQRGGCAISQNAIRAPLQCSSLRRILLGSRNSTFA